ncbi:hypothetical protein ACVWXU_007473 [Streptomyces sp. TE33382]
MEVAAVELDDAGRRGGEGDQDAGGVDGARHGRRAAVAAQGHLLPGGVAGGGDARGRVCPEGPGAGPGDDEPLGHELGDGPGDGDGADPEPFDEGAAGRQFSAG